MLTENAFERLSDPVVGIAEEYILNLLKQLQKIARRLIDDPTVSVDMREQLQKVRSLQSSFLGNAEEWTTDAIPKAYIRGIEDINGTIEELGVSTEVRQMQFTGGLFAAASGGGGVSIPNKVREMFAKYPNHLTMYEVFTAAVNDDFRRTNIPVLRDMEDKIRDLVVQASDIDYQEANVFTRRQLTQDIMDDFARQNITGIRYSDGRTMNIDTYSEMVARTQTGNAARQAQLNRLNELGHDLVRMSVHWPVSPLCVDWQGGVYDQNGNSSKYPALSTAINGGAFHVNCKHSLSGYFPGTSKKIEDRNKFDKKENERRYNLQNQQRYNERHIRYWKRREATALTDDARSKAKSKVRQWQKRNRELVSENDFLRRKYARESI